MQTRRGLAILASLVIIGTAVLPGVGFATATLSMGAHGIGASPTGLTATTPTKYNSTNWAGYFAETSSSTVKDTVSYVSGTWVQPAVNCANGKTAIMAMWVGIDGATDSTVEQTGSIGQCVSGVASYYVWWELYPKNAVQPITSITLAAGNTVTASVTWNSANSFTMKIAVGSHSFSKTASQKGTALRENAECIVERPSGSSGLYSLAKFTKASFSACSATISGTTGAIGTFGVVGQINMVNNAGTKFIATTGSANSKGGFTVTWKGYH